MKNSLVSVVIPIYNVEKYLVECVESVRNQSYTDLQIILVDDGSDDLSGQLCEEQAKQDSRIIVIHKENGGLSDARNVGVTHATGEYVFYLDSDDYLETDAIERLMECQKQHEAQIVVGNYFYTYADNEDTAKCEYQNEGVLTTQEAMRGLVTGKIQNFAWGKLIRADIAKKYEFPKGKLFEDNYWAHYVLNAAERIVILDKPIVHYRQRTDSISYTFNIKRLDILEGWIARKAFLEKEYPELISEFMQHIAENYLNIAWLILTRMKNKRNEAFHKLREFNGQLQLEKYVHGKKREMIIKLNSSIIAYAFDAVIEKVKGKV